ncbi:ATP-binding protein [Algoriphagus confluentis]|uniref:ATP-binding protein n=1 Tax=Algoriphagus confluentis TaxID=1697556 RepID=A0ABQ6PLJ8_9BACT|nr:ATP-binding protein [Algoriphagus confluentis]
MRRKIFIRLKEHLKREEATLLIGPRQSGKSTLLKQLEAECKSENIPTVYINLENKSFLAELDSNPLHLLAYSYNPLVKTVFFLDEIQYLSDPTNFIKLLYDEHRAQVKLVVSGSSAFYLDEKFKDSLVGRKRIFRLNTCDFEETLLLQGKEELHLEYQKIKSSPKYKSVKSDFLKLEFEKYLIYGGYPAVVIEQDEREKKELLKDIRDSFVKRDILESGIKNELLFYQLFRILAEQTGQLIKVNELSNTLKTRSETIHNYLRIMQICFHVETVRPFYSNVRKELIKMPKIYFLDLGLRNCLLMNFQSIQIRMDRGELWENAVFRSLTDRFGPEEIRFWRTADGKEVDFVLPEIEDPIALEVKLDQKSNKQSKYKLFTESYPSLPFRFVNLSPWNEEVLRKEF